jgi:plastocyanin
LAKNSLILRLAVFLAALLAAPFLLPGTSAAVGTAIVTVDGGLAPQHLTVQVGTTVTWQLRDADKHRIRSTSGPVQFDSGGLDPGGSYSFTFSTLGATAYRDDEFKNVSQFVGSVTVVANDPGPGTGGGPGGGTTVPPSTTAPAPTTTTIHMANRTFAPGSISIITGSTVIWSNDDKDTHTVSARSGAFDSGNVNAGGSFRRTFAAPGTFSYFCQIHPSMVGSVTVSTPPTGGTLPPPPPPPTPPTTAPPTTPPPGTPTTQPPAGTVRIVDYGFSPAVLTIDPNTTVTWTNTGLARHTVTADDNSFASPDVNSGSTYRHRFSTAGTFTYLCQIHPEMTATIKVRGVGGTPAPPAPSTTATPAITALGDVRIADYSFSPATLSIKAGTSLTFVNTGAARHTATAKDGSFDTGILARGATARRTFANPGTFIYLCVIHPSMTGTILVSGSDGAPPPPPKAAPTVATGAGDVKMVDFAFTPNRITVAVGGSVGFVNGGVAPHTATARDGSFDTGVVAPGTIVRHRFPAPGTFSFYCTIHPQMTGTVLVVGADGAPPPAEKPAKAPAAPAAPARTPSKVTVKVLAEHYDHPTVRVAEGGTVTWTIESLSPHIIAADDGTSFTSGVVPHGGTFEHTFPRPGTFAYHDGLTGDMPGTVIVVPAAGTVVKGASADGLTASVDIVDLAFDPVDLAVVKGATVTWTNQGQAPHTVTSRDGDWTSDMLPTNAQFSHTFDTVGRFEYLCTLHPGMSAQVTVSEAVGAPVSVVQQAAGPVADPGQPGHSGSSTLVTILLAGMLFLGMTGFLAGRRSSRTN